MSMEELQKLIDELNKIIDTTNDINNKEGSISAKKRDILRNDTSRLQEISEKVLLLAQKLGNEQLQTIAEEIEDLKAERDIIDSKKTITQKDRLIDNAISSKAGYSDRKQIGAITELLEELKNQLAEKKHEIQSKINEQTHTKERLNKYNEKENLLKEIKDTAEKMSTTVRLAIMKELDKKGLIEHEEKLNHMFGIKEIEMQEQIKWKALNDERILKEELLKSEGLSFEERKEVEKEVQEIRNQMTSYIHNASIYRDIMDKINKLEEKSKDFSKEETKESIKNEIDEITEKIDKELSEARERIQNRIKTRNQEKEINKLLEEKNQVIKANMSIIPIDLRLKLSEKLETAGLLTSTMYHDYLDESNYTVNEEIANVENIEEIDALIEKIKSEITFARAEIKDYSERQMELTIRESTEGLNKEEKRYKEEVKRYIEKLLENIKLYLAKEEIYQKTRKAYLETDKTIDEIIEGVKRIKGEIAESKTPGANVEENVEKENKSTAIIPLTSEKEKSEEEINEGIKKSEESGKKLVELINKVKTNNDPFTQMNSVLNEKKSNDDPFTQMNEAMNDNQDKVESTAIVPVTPVKEEKIESDVQEEPEQKEQKITNVRKPKNQSRIKRFIRRNIHKLVAGLVILGAALGITYGVTHRKGVEVPVEETRVSNGTPEIEIYPSENSNVQYEDEILDNQTPISTIDNDKNDLMYIEEDPETIEEPNEIIQTIPSAVETEITSDIPEESEMLVEEPLEEKPLEETPEMRQQALRDARINQLGGENEQEVINGTGTGISDEDLKWYDNDLYFVPGDVNGVSHIVEVQPDGKETKMKNVPTSTITQYIDSLARQRHMDPEDLYEEVLNGYTLNVVDPEGPINITAPEYETNELTQDMLKRAVLDSGMVEKSGENEWDVMREIYTGITESNLPLYYENPLYFEYDYNTNTAKVYRKLKDGTMAKEATKIVPREVADAYLYSLHTLSNTPLESLYDNYTNAAMETVTKGVSR